MFSGDFGVSIDNFFGHFKDGPDKGIIPLTCMELFERVRLKSHADPHLNFTVEVSYIEVRSIYLQMLL